VLAQFRAQARQLLEHETGVALQGEAGGRRLHAPSAAHEQGHAQGFFHVLDTFARGRQRQIGAPAAGRDAAGVQHVQEQLQVNEVESHVGRHAKR